MSAPYGVEARYLSPVLLMPDSLLLFNIRLDINVVLHVCRKQPTMTVTWSSFAHHWRRTVPTDTRQVPQAHISNRVTATSQNLYMLLV